MLGLIVAKGAAIIVTDVDFALAVAWMMERRIVRVEVAMVAHLAILDSGT